MELSSALRCLSASANEACVFFLVLRVVSFTPTERPIKTPRPDVFCAQTISLGKQKHFTVGMNNNKSVQMASH